MRDVAEKTESKQKAGCRMACAPQRAAHPVILRAVMLFCASAIWGGGTQAAETLTYVDPVKRMTDMEHLAVLPPEGEKGAMASSYDRASKYDAVADKYLQWDANGDGKGFVRQEGDRIVMAEFQGPGCIWRIWSACPSETGHVRMYFDGSSTASVDMTFRDYFGSPQMPWTDLAYCPNCPGLRPLRR